MCYQLKDIYFWFFYYRNVLVLVESIVSGHRMTRIRERLADKLEFIFFDPYGK